MVLIQFFISIIIYNSSTRDETDDEEWGWDDSPSKANNIEISGMEMTPDKKLKNHRSTMLSSENGGFNGEKPPTRSTSIRSRGSSQSPLNHKESIAASSMVSKTAPIQLTTTATTTAPAPDPDDFFEQMGLAAKPTFNAPKRQQPAASKGANISTNKSTSIKQPTSILPQVPQQRSSSITIPLPVLPNSTSVHNNNSNNKKSTKLGATVLSLSSNSDDEMGADDWDDDADLDDLLKD